MKSAMKLYYAPGASSLAHRIVACEAGLPLDYDKVDLKTQTTSSGLNYGHINPKGYVPALGISDGAVLTEAPVILEYLASQAPDTGLLPAAGSLERYRLQEWLGFISTELHKGFAPLWAAPTLNTARQEAVENLHKHFDYLDSCLKGRHYLMGDTFTVADPYCFAVLTWTRFHRINLSAYSCILAFMRRVFNRPKVMAALEAEGLLQHFQSPHGAAWGERHLVAI
jgi:glutathione S-transferase